MTLKQLTATFLSVAMFVSWTFAAPPQTRTPSEDRALTEFERLTAQGKSLVEQGKRREALPLYEKMLAIRKAELGEEHIATSLAHYNLGVLSSDLGEYKAARPHLESSLRILKKTAGEEHLDTANVHHVLGMVLRAQSDYRGARFHFEEVLRIRRKLLGEEHPYTATAHSLLGVTLDDQGEYASAKLHDEQTLRIRRKALGEEHIDTAQAYNNLGVNLIKTGNLTGARPYIEKALEIDKKVLGEEHIVTAYNHDSIGALLQRLGDFRAARPHLEQALRVKSRVLGEESPDMVHAHSNLGLLLMSQGEYSAARTHIEQALNISQKIHGEEHLETAGAHQNLASLLKIQGKYSDAQPHLEQAVKIEQMLLGTNHPTTAEVMMHLGEVDAALSHWDVAGRLIDGARRSSQRQIARELISLSETEQLAYLEQNEESNRDIALTLGFERPQDQTIVDLTASWLLNGKAISQSALAARNLAERDVDPNNPLVLERDVVRQKLVAASLAAPKADQAATLRERLRQLGEDEVKLTRALLETSKSARQPTPWVELDELRKALPADGVFINISRFKRFNFQSKRRLEVWRSAEYVAWVIPPAGAGVVQMIDLGPAEPIDLAVETARKSIASAASKDGILLQQGERAADQQVRQDLQAVAELVWSPLSDSVKTAKRLIISPDGALWLLPWGALPMPENRFLIEDYSLHYLVSGRELVMKDTTELSTSRPVVMADPNFDATLQRMKQVLDVLKVQFPNLRFGKQAQTRSVSSELPKVARLPGTAAEARLIQPTLTKWAGEPLAYKADEALETVFKQVRRPKVVVLSTHGFFLPDQETKRDEATALVPSGSRSAPLAMDGTAIENPLLRCGLLLAGCNSPRLAGMDDGVLTGMEIVELDLRGTKLVVLSACETGVGQIRNGEGVAGLRQAFQLAGAQAVVATLWQVPDTDSARLMNDFFANLADGQSKIDALRAGQLKRIAARRERYGAAHPYFWAAFTLTGQ